MDFEGITANACEKNGCELTVTRHSKANYFDPTNPVVDKLTTVYNNYMGLNTKPFVMSGGTYARKLPNAFAFGTGMPLPKAPAGLFLPGHGDYHQPDEIFFFFLLALLIASLFTSKEVSDQLKKILFLS